MLDYVKKTFSSLHRRGFLSFLEGVGLALTLYPEKYQLRNFKKKSDFEAIKGDWEAVGNDLYRAMNKFKKHQMA